MIKLNIIETGFFISDGGAMFGPIPKRYWSKKYPCDENNCCEMVMRSLLIEDGERKILVDTGAGNKHYDKLKFYNIHDEKDLLDELSKLKVSREEITDVVLTHLHFDHCGYSTYNNEEGVVVPTFPNAKYWLSRSQWENFLQPNLFEKDSFFEDNILPVKESNQLKLIDSDVTLTENISLQLFDGHTSGQIALYISSDDTFYIYASDVIPTSEHIRPTWLSAYDNSFVKSMEEKVRMLNFASKNSCRIIFCHDAYTLSAVVYEKDGMFFSKDKKKR